MADPTIRVTTYQLMDNAGAFSGATYTLTLNNNLAANYYVKIRGTGYQDGAGPPNDTLARVTSDPFGTGDLDVSGADDTIILTRIGTDGNWQGYVTVVECLGDTAASGFVLLGVVVVALADTVGSNTGASSAWSDINQVGVYGGNQGGGVTSDRGANTQHEHAWCRSYPSAATTINVTRINTAGLTTVTGYVVEWGSEWTIQSINITGANFGAGVDATGEYSTGAIDSVVRANTFLIWSGSAADPGVGNGLEGTVVTLGDGVNQNASETTVAIGSHHDPGSRDFQVYVHEHSDLAVDQVFGASGTAIPAADKTGSMTVDAAGGAESYDNATATVQYTEGQRCIIGSNSSESNYNSGYSEPMVGWRPTASTTATWTRARNRSIDGAAWIQSVDFAGIEYGAAPAGGPPVGSLSMMGVGR